MTSCGVVMCVLRIYRLVQTRNDGVDSVKTMLRYGLDGLIVRIKHVRVTVQIGIMSCGAIRCVWRMGKSVRTRNDGVDSVKSMLRYRLYGLIVRTKHARVTGQTLITSCGASICVLRRCVSVSSGGQRLLENMRQKELMMRVTTLWYNQGKECVRRRELACYD